MSNLMQEGAGVNLVLSKRFGVQGAPAQNMASELFPTHEALDWDTYPENAFLEGARIARGGASQAAVAGQFSHVGIINPPGGTNTLAVVRSLNILDETGASRTLQIGFANLQALTPAAVLSNGFSRDSRLSVTGSPTVCQIFTLAQVAALGGGLQAVRLTTNTQLTIQGPWVLAPGSLLHVRTNAVNGAVRANFTWHERTITRGELQGALDF